MKKQTKIIITAVKTHDHYRAYLLEGKKGFFFVKRTQYRLCSNSNKEAYMQRVKSYKEVPADELSFITERECLKKCQEVLCRKFLLAPKSQWINYLFIEF